MELQKTRLPGTIHPNSIPLIGVIEIGATGSIVNQTGNRDAGITWVQNGTGRYDGTIHKSYRRFMNGDAGIVFPTAGTVPAISDGVSCYVQGISSAQTRGVLGNGTGTVTILVTRTDTQAAANPASGNFVSYEIWVSESA